METKEKMAEVSMLVPQSNNEEITKSLPDIVWLRVAKDSDDDEGTKFIDRSKSFFRREYGRELTEVFFDGPRYLTSLLAYRVFHLGMTPQEAIADRATTFEAKGVTFRCCVFTKSSAVPITWDEAVIDLAIDEKSREQTRGFLDKLENLFAPEEPEEKSAPTAN